MLLRISLGLEWCWFLDYIISTVKASVYDFPIEIDIVARHLTLPIHLHKLMINKFRN